MRRTSFSLTKLVFASAAALAAVACTSILGDFNVSDQAGSGNPDGTTGDGAVGNKPNGTVCGAAGECGSGFCADGVCCEAACDGTCESCVVGERGKCLPVPDGQDPQKECVGATLDGGGGTISDEDGGTVLDIDGGLLSDDTKCAGACNGARACKFPDKQTECGSQFCSSETTSKGSRCDSAGHCAILETTCEGFGCDPKDGTCITTCTSDSECASTHYCKESTCRKKLGNGQECTLGTQCGSTFCFSGVCCDSDCGETPGGDCKAPGREGTCTCNHPGCEATGCRLFYKDSDGDGFGDPNVTIAQVGCIGATPPATFVLDNTDCNDQDNRVHPGQTEFFETATAVKGDYDFNCNGVEEKSIKEYIGESCGFCRPPEGTARLTCDDKRAKTCFANGQPATLDCRLAKKSLLCAIGDPSCYSCDGSGTGVKINPPLDKGFTAAVACGANGAFTDCGGCTTAGGTVTGTDGGTARQKCR